MTYSPLRFLPTILKKSRPIHLVMFVTKVCNARCAFCFYLEDANFSLEEGDMSMEEITQVSKSLGTMLWIAFSGGEVFLRKDLPQIAQTFYKNNKPSIMFFPTNGIQADRILATTEEILKTCPKTAVTVKISIDAIGDLHSQMRGVKNTFENCVKTYEALNPLLDKYPNFDLAVNTVFAQANQDHVAEVIEYVRKWRVTTHTLSLARGDLKNPEWKNVNMELYRKHVDRLAKEMRSGDHPIYRFWGGRIKAAQDIIQREMIYKTAVEGRWQTPCYAGRINVTVTHDGKLYPCEELSEDFRIADMRKEGSFDIQKWLHSDRANQIKQRIDNGCFCTHECYAMTNLLFNPKLSAKILSGAMKLPKAKGPRPAAKPTA
ncbi:MAG: radical SAM/SPASM domain-containing protein [Planctomycetota bacterium]|nr:radical SAM/SPASM domain-containing protein [Planctomycetota bacterium]